jgi:hypothetical protein
MSDRTEREKFDEICGNCGKENINHFVDGDELSCYAGSRNPQFIPNPASQSVRTATQEKEVSGDIDPVSVLRDLLENRNCSCGGWTCARCEMAFNDGKAVVGKSTAPAGEQQLEQEYWLCFNCGFKTSDREEALAHFGDSDEGRSLCQVWADLNADDRAQEYQSQIRERNATERKNASLRTRVEGLEYAVESQEGCIRSYKPFKNCRSIHDVFCVYDSMEGRALAAEERAEISGIHVSQAKMTAWGQRCFGVEHMSDVKIRGLRMLEESIEFAQAVEIESWQVTDLANYVYSRPKGTPQQELGGVLVTALVSASALGVSAQSVLDAEMQRVLSKPPEHFTVRNQAKCDAGFK